MKKLTIEEIEEARVVVLENAQSLFLESQLLFEHGFYARAYTLSHICCEEIAKIPMLVGAGMDLVNGDVIDWSKLSKRFTSHVNKLDALHINDYFQTEIRSDYSDVRDLEVALKTTNKQNEAKNQSLYSGIHNNKFKKPSDIINKAITEEKLNEAKARLSYISEAEKLTRGKISISDGSLRLRKLLKS